MKLTKQSNRKPQKSFQKQQDSSKLSNKRWAHMKESEEDSLKQLMSASPSFLLSLLFPLAIVSLLPLIFPPPEAASALVSNPAPQSMGVHSRTFGPFG